VTLAKVGRLFLQITKLFCFPIFRAYLMKGIPETRRVH